MNVSKTATLHLANAFQDFAIALNRVVAVIRSDEAPTKKTVAKKAVAPKMAASTKRAPKSISTEALLQYVGKNPGQRSEQIEAALGWPKAKVKAGLVSLRAARRVKTKGVKRGTTYRAV